MYFEQFFNIHRYGYKYSYTLHIYMNGLIDVCQWFLNLALDWDYFLSFYKTRYSSIFGD